MARRITIKAVARPVDGAPKMPRYIEDMLCDMILELAIDHYSNAPLESKASVSLEEQRRLHINRLHRIEYARRKARKEAEKKKAL